MHLTEQLKNERENVARLTEQVREREATIDEQRLKINELGSTMEGLLKKLQSS